MQKLSLGNEDFYLPIEESLRQVQTRLDAYQQAKFPERPSEFFALELCGEAGELANLEKKRWKGKTIAHEALSDEAADVLIALVNYANARGINLGEAVRNKLLRIEEKRKTLEERGESY